MRSRYDQSILSRASYLLEAPSIRLFVQSLTDDYLSRIEKVKVEGTDRKGHMIHPRRCLTLCTRLILGVYTQMLCKKESVFYFHSLSIQVE